MTIQLDTIDLPAGIAWTDEYSALAPIAQTARRRLSGALTLFQTPLQAGRAITLDCTEAPITRAQAAALAALAAVPGASYPLTFTLRSPVETYLVAFRHHDPPVLDLRPLIDYADPIDSDWMIGVIHLMTV